MKPEIVSGILVESKQKFIWVIPSDIRINYKMLLAFKSKTWPNEIPSWIPFSHIFGLERQRADSRIQIHSVGFLSIKTDVFWEGHKNIYASPVVKLVPAPVQGNWVYDNLKPKVRIMCFLFSLNSVFLEKLTQKKLSKFAKTSILKW